MTIFGQVCYSQNFVEFVRVDLAQNSVESILRKLC